MTIDIKNMTRRELEALQGRIANALEKIKKNDRKKALAAAEAAAKQHGFSLAQLSPVEKKPAKAAKPAKKSQPRFKHPENAKVTWTGKGRRPDWIKEGLASGKKLEDFAI